MGLEGSDVMIVKREKKNRGYLDPFKIAEFSDVFRISWLDVNEGCLECVCIYERGLVGEE
jgi:hypothetical protein